MIALKTDFTIEFERNLKPIGEAYDIKEFFDILRKDLSLLLDSYILAKEEFFELVYNTHQTIIVGVESYLTPEDYEIFKRNFFLTINTTLRDALYDELYEQAQNLKEYKKIMRELL